MNLTSGRVVCVTPMKCAMQSSYQIPNGVSVVCATSYGRLVELLLLYYCII